MRFATLIVPGKGETAAAVSPDGARYHPLDGPLAGRLGGPLPRIEPDWTPAPPLAEARFAPPIPRPGAVWCVGLNYEDHRLETGKQKADHPTLFTRFPGLSARAPGSRWCARRSRTSSTTRASWRW